MDQFSQLKYDIEPHCHFHLIQHLFFLPDNEGRKLIYHISDEYLRAFDNPRAKETFPLPKGR